MSSHNPTSDFFENLAADDEPLGGAGRAASSLKSRIYSALVRLQTTSGPLLGLRECQAAGHGLCVFEQFVRIAPIGERLKSMNPCQVCHARVLAERLDNAPIYWPHCPYVKFQER
jgi:hypothetical protein